MKRTLALLLLFLSSAALAGEAVRRFSMGGNIDVRAAPRGAVLHTMGGDIHVDRANGDIVAKTMGGDIRIGKATASVRAGTLGGDVEVDVLRAATDRSIDLSSLGGSLAVTLPKDFSAEFEIELEYDRDGPQGKIISDFPLTIQKSARRRWLRKVTVLTATGMTGSGANRVRLTTIGGDITIRRR